MSKKESAVAKYIEKTIDLNGLRQRDIADAVGWENPNMVSIIKSGQSKVPLEKVFPLAKALNLDPTDLFIRVFSEYYPGLWKDIEQTLKGWVLTQSEQALVTAYRKKIAHGSVLSAGNADALTDQLTATLKR